jgi:hypothetical protein
MSLRPTSVEPVNDSFRARGSLMSGSMTEPDDFAVMTFSTPPGRPASSRICASASIDRGVCLAGLMTAVHPAAICGPIFRVPIASGKFHGVMKMHGPTGWRIVITRKPPFSAGLYVPSTRVASPAYQCRKSAA